MLLNYKGKKNLVGQIEEKKKQKICADKVVSLNDFRDLRNATSGRVILVVDDDETMRNAVKRILEGDGFTVVTASDGIELSRILETQKLELIILDVNLPWVDGFELCNIIKTDSYLGQIPIIFITGKKNDDDIKKGYEVGCSDYIIKPFEIDELTGSVKKCLQKSG